jgi:hypothetical protein
LLFFPFQKAFREDPSVRILLMSLKAGGVALNLTVANEAYLLDPWWNPAAEMQAIDRVSFTLLFGIGSHLTSSCNVLQLSNPSLFLPPSYFLKLRHTALVNTGRFVLYDSLPREQLKNASFNYKKRND